MVITSDANLIAYDQRHHPLQPFLPENAGLMAENLVQHHYCHEQMPLDKMTAADHNANRYDSHQFLYYAGDYQIGRLIDLYA